jgi:hypothetical protein
LPPFFFFFMSAILWIRLHNGLNCHVAVPLNERCPGGQGTTTRPDVCAFAVWVLALDVKEAIGAAGKTEAGNPKALDNDGLVIHPCKPPMTKDTRTDEAGEVRLWGWC